MEKSPPRSHEKDLRDVERALEKALDLVRNTPHEDLKAVDWLESAAAVGELLADVREASGRIRQTLLGSARTAVLLYMRGHVGESVSPHALEGVAAIREWPRRIRELRSPFGWQIESGTWRADLQNDHYLLTADRLGEEVATDPRVVEAIRGKTSKERILEYLLHLSPWPAGPQQLERLAGVPTWRQDIHELIDEGWLIRTHEDEPNLVPGSYRLARLED